MITDDQIPLIQQEYYDRGILKKEVRSYEVSLWTLQDEFLTVLKWSDVEQKGRIQNPEMTLNVDGTQNFTFEIPMYINSYMLTDNFSDEPITSDINLRRENPNWYNRETLRAHESGKNLGGNLITSMRKIKVIFNKQTKDEQVFEFLIIKVTETHTNDQLTCKVECEGLAFHELGKIGYRITLNTDTFLEDYKKWFDEISTKTTSEAPIQSLNYWCNKAGLIAWGSDEIVNPSTWYYQIQAGWGSFQDGNSRDVQKIYEEEYTTDWDNDLTPIKTQPYREKARAIDVKESNLYNITQTIAETFGVYCRYEYGYDDNYHIISRKVIFYNNFFSSEDKYISFTYPNLTNSISRSMDSTDLTTKLYVSSIDDETLYSGSVSIMDSEANKTMEDYILNFDYLYDIGTITKDQYIEIKKFEKQIRSLNKQIIPLQQKIQAIDKQIIDKRAQQTILEESIKLDSEQIEQVHSLQEALANKGEISIRGASAESCVVMSNIETGKIYANLGNSRMGVLAGTVKIYDSMPTIENGKEVGTEITEHPYYYEYDEYGFVVRVVFTVPFNESKIIYASYQFSPNKYYTTIQKIWKKKLAKDQRKLLGVYKSLYLSYKASDGKLHTAQADDNDPDVYHIYYDFEKQPDYNFKTQENYSEFAGNEIKKQEQLKKYLDEIGSGDHDGENTRAGL